MNNHQRNVALSVTAIVLIALLFMLVMTGSINALVAIVLTLAIGYGVRVLRGMLIKP